MNHNQNIDLKITSNDTFREIFQSSAEGIIMVDSKGIIILANPVTDRMFGYGQGELIGKALEVLLPDRYKEDHVHLRKTFAEHPSPRRMGFGRDLMAMRNDGTEFPVEVSLSYKEIDGELLVMAFIIDISERKKAEDALKSSEEQLLIYAAELERKVQTRTEALNESVTELEKEIEVRKKAEEESRKALARERELNDLKSKFVSIASHEFRTPLSTILSSASLVNQYREKGDLDKIEKHTLRIKSNVNHLTAILNDFLSLGKLEEGRVELAAESTQICEFLLEIDEEIKLMLKEGQRIVLDCPTEDKAVKIDPRILRNVLFNLLSNASKYSDPHKNIYINYRNNINTITIQVRDEGMGIPDDDKKHMFERFFRGSNAGNIQGTGLGLNIVKRYIDLMHGTITFESVYEKGSTFTIDVPVVN